MKRSKKPETLMETPAFLQLAKTVRARVGRQVRVERRKKALSQGALAGKIGLHRTYLGAIERGQANPSLDILLAISVALSVILEDLVKTDSVLG